MLVEGEKLMREAAQLKLPVSDALFDADMADRFADLARDTGAGGRARLRRAAALARGGVRHEDAAGRVCGIRSARFF